MRKNVFLLGPNEWDDGVDVPAPLWIESLLGTAPEPFTPKHLREAAAVKIAADSRGKVQGVVMDPKAQRPGEDDAAFFARIERESDIHAYFFILPLHCKMLGTTFELGMVQRDLQWGRNPIVHLFVQEGFARVDANENWSFEEKGHRTRYFSSLARHAHNVQTWKSFELLIDEVTSWALLEDGF